MTDIPFGRDAGGHGKAKESPEETGALHRALFTQARDSMLLLEFGPDGVPVIRDANEAALRMHGYSLEELIDKPVLFLVADDSNGSAVRERLGLIQSAGGALFEARHRRRDGSVFDVEVSVRKMEIGGKRWLLDISRDITGRKKAEETLARLELMLDAAPGAITIHDPGGRYFYVNQRALDMHGYTREEFLSLTVHQLDVPESRRFFKERIKELLDRGEIACEVSHFKKDGTILPMEMTAKLIAWGDKKAVLSIGLDITGRKRAGEALRKICSELQAEKKLLADKNTAFREVINQIEVEKNRQKDEIIVNVNELILPIVKRLGLEGGASRKYLDLLEKSLRTLVSSFGRRLTETSLKLTPKEKEVSNMIKSGLTTKEISGLLNASPQTINKHRNNIRKKLGLANKRINLTTFLQTL